MAVNIAQREQYIARTAQSYGLDPKAVLAIASHEGLSGGVGDNGTSFGPFQLHRGGALPGNVGSNAQAWAWSNQGINYALRQMVADGAKGLNGRAAVSAISRNFERPADPAGEIADAMAHYGKVGSFKGSVPAGAGFGGGGQVITGSGTRFDMATYRKQASALLMQNAMAEANGGIDPQTGQAPPPLVSALEAARQAATVKVQSGGPLQGGTKINPGSGIGAQAAKMALKQVGAPYVWGGENAKGGGNGAGFDCSGLVQWAYGALGIKLPRTAAEQGKMGKAVSYKSMKPGDLLVENNGDHIVMYIGNGKVVQAPHTGTNVQVSPLSYFPSSQYNARRIAG